jgi:hypothetical protein
MQGDTATASDLLYSLEGVTLFVGSESSGTGSLVLSTTYVSSCLVLVLILVVLSIGNHKKDRACLGFTLKS